MQYILLYVYVLKEITATDKQKIIDHPDCIRN